jgi:hypothetical protein
VSGRKGVDSRQVKIGKRCEVLLLLTADRPLRNSPCSFCNKVPLAASLKSVLKADCENADTELWRAN